MSFSVTAKPTAVEVKLLLVEYRVCLSSGRYGAHQPSAITFPWRSIIILWNSCLSAAAESRNVRRPADDTPSASGVLRGREAEAGLLFLQPPDTIKRMNRKKTVMAFRVFMGQ